MFPAARSTARSGSCQHTGCFGIDRVGSGSIALGLVDSRVCSGIDDDVGADGADGVCDPVQIGKVATKISAAPVQRNDLPQR